MGIVEASCGGLNSLPVSSDTLCHMATKTEVSTRLELTSLNIRGLDPEVRDFIRATMGARGLTYAGYVERLVKLHRTMLDTRTGTNVDAPYLYAGLLKHVGLEAVKV